MTVISQLDLKPLQEVAVSSGRYGRITFGYKVVAVTATGQVTVEKTEDSSMKSVRRFGSDGYEMAIPGVYNNLASRKYDRATLVTDVATRKAIIEEKRALEAALKTITDIQLGRGPVYDRATALTEIDRIRVALDAAQSQVEALPVAPEFVGAIRY